MGYIYGFCPWLLAIGLLEFWVEYTDSAGILLAPSYPSSSDNCSITDALPSRATRLAIDGSRGNVREIKAILVMQPS